MAKVIKLKTFGIFVSTTLFVAIHLMMAAGNQQIYRPVRLTGDAAQLKSYYLSTASLDQSQIPQKHISWRIVCGGYAVRDEIEEKDSFDNDVQLIITDFHPPFTSAFSNAGIIPRQDEKPRNILSFAADRSPPVFIA